MISRVTGEVDFRSGLRIIPHCSIQLLSAGSESSLKVETRKLSLKGWKRHVLGLHDSEHGTFEVEALSSDDCVYVVLLSHRHPFYEKGTFGDAERRAFHEGVVTSDLGGQREFAWGEIIHRLESIFNLDWLVVAYSRESKVPLPEKEVLLRLFGHDNLPEDNEGV
jgi:hypothetical protein